MGGACLKSQKPTGKNSLMEMAIGFKSLTRDSDDSHLMYFLMKSIKYETCLFLSTAHLFFFIIGASPVAFNRTSTDKE